MIGAVAVVATFASVSLIRCFGKRNLFLLSSIGVVLSMGGLGETKFQQLICFQIFNMKILMSFCFPPKKLLVVYGYLYLPADIKSFDKKIKIIEDQTSIIPLILFCILRFFTIGTTLVVMTILSELFPLKIRSIASGIATAISNVLTFGAIRTYYDFEEMTSMQGALLIYTVVGAFG